MGAAKGNSVVKDLLDYYATADFEISRGLDLQPNTSRITQYFETEFGLEKPYDGKNLSWLDENSVIYPATHFCTPADGHDNFAIHHFNGSWVDAYSRKKKLSFFGKFVFVRFRKNAKIESNDLPLYTGEKLLFSFKVSESTYGIIVKLKTE
jgi:hypothetical protein